MNNLRFVGLSAIRRYTMLLLLWAMAAMAWAQDCSFSISHTMTPGVCTADGAIKVDIINTTAPTSTQFQYLLFNITAGGEPATIRTTERSYTFTNLVPGRYRVEVIAQCAGGSASSQSINDINVTTTYVPMIGGHNQDLSRDSYACGTGRIVVSLSKGKGRYTIRIANGPMRVGETIPYTVVSTGEYQLDYEDWKPGTYKIAVTDECNNVFAFDVIVRKIEAFPELPGLDFKGISTTDCKTILLEYKVSNAGLEQVTKSIAAGVFEIGFALRGQSEADISWFVLSNTSGSVSLTSSKSWYETLEELSQYSGYYSDTVSVNLRLKSCPWQRKQYKKLLSFSKRFEIQFASSSTNSTCKKPSGLQVKMGELGIFCAPITYELRAEINGANKFLGTKVHHTPRDWSSDIPIPDNIALPSKERDTLRIHLKATDANGHVATQTYLMSVKFKSRVTNYIERAKIYDYYTSRELHLGSSSSQDFTCNVKARLYNADSLMIQELTLPAEFRHLEVGKKYFIKYIEGDQVLQEVPVEGPKPTTPPIGDVNKITPEFNSNGSAISYGGITLWIEGKIGKNSHFTVTGPEGYSYRREIEFETSGTNYYPVTTSILPRGTYTFKFYNSYNGKTLTTTYDHLGFYQVEDFDYDVTYGCGLAYIRPRATVKLGKRVLRSDEYVFFIHPKNQAVQEIVVREGEAITLSKEGEYIISLAVKKSSQDRTYQHYLEHLKKHDYQDDRLVDIPITYKTPSLNIDSTRTLAYACANNVLGDIYIQAHGGIAPYTYQLFLDPDYQQPARYTDGREVKQTGASAVYFKYGQMGQTYYVRYTDACGSLQKYKIRMLNVNDLQLAYAVPSRVCSGGTVSLRMAGPEVFRKQTTALWRDPQGRTINSSNGSVDRELVDVTAAKAGMYSVVFTLPGCGTPVTNQVNVEVTNAVNSTIPSTTEYTACVGKSIAIQGATTTEPKASISWQYAMTRTLNPDFLTGTSDEEYIYRWKEHPALENATQSTLNMSFYKPGLYALRNFISYGCELVSPPILVRVRYCYVPLNPHLMHRPSVDWSGVFLPPLLN